MGVLKRILCRITTSVRANRDSLGSMVVSRASSVESGVIAVMNETRVNVTTMVVLLALGLVSLYKPLAWWAAGAGILVVAAWAYWFGWTGHVSDRYGKSYLAAPAWLSWLCGRRGRRLVPQLVLVQAGAIGAACGMVLGDALRLPRPVVGTYLYRGAAVGCILVAVPWLFWGIWRLLSRRSHESPRR